MHDFKINQLRAFVCIVDQGGFHAAANFLHKTQPAITQSIQALESELEAPLFIKGNKIKLTSFGKSFLVHARDFLDYHDNIRSLVYNNQRIKNKTITIATLPSVAQTILPEIIKRVSKSYPDIYLTIRDENSHQIERLLEESKVDFAISAINPENQRFHCHELLQDPFGLVGHNSHALCQAKTLTWKKAGKLSLIQNGTWRILPLSIRNNLLANSTMSIVNMNALNAALESQVGVTILPKLAVNTRLESLKFIDIKYPAINRKLGIIWSKENPLSETSKLVFDVIENSVQDIL